MASDISIAKALSGDAGSEERELTTEEKIIETAKGFARDTKIDIILKDSQLPISGIFFLFFVENDEFERKHGDGLGKIYYKFKKEDQPPYGNYIETKLIGSIQKSGQQDT